MTWYFLRYGLPNNAAILALALVPFVSLGLGGAHAAKSAHETAQRKALAAMHTAAIESNATVMVSLSD